MRRLSDPYQRMFSVLSGVAALAILGSTMAKNPALPLLAKSIGANDAEVGLIAAVGPIPGILISGFVGAYSDRIGRAPVLTSSLVIFATAPFTYLFVTEPWQLMLVRFYHGFATAAFMPVAMAAVADWYSSRRRGEKLATYSSATMVGRFVAPFLGGALIYFANFGSVYLTCAATGLLALAFSFAIPWKRSASQGRSPNSAVSSLRSLRNVMSERGIIVTSSMEGLQYYAMGAFETFLPLYSLSLGYNGLEIGAIMGIQVVSMLVSKPFLGALSDRKGREPSIVAGLLVGFATIAMMPHVTDLMAIAFLSLAFGVSVATVTASTSALVSELAASSEHGSAIGVLSSVMDIGHSAGPLATGIIVGAVSFGAGFGVAGVLLLIGAAIFTVGVWRIRR